MAEVRAGVLFDVDGTLVDSNYVHVAAWLRAFHDVGQPVEGWRIHRAIGMDSQRMLKELLGADASALADDVKELHSRAYLESADLLVVLPGARELIRELDDRGVRVVLATSAPADELTLLRSVLDLDDAITACTSADDVDTAKPDPGIVLVAQQRSGCALEDVTFVGDSVWDVRAARRAGVAAVGVLSGGISAKELRDAGAHDVYPDARAILGRLDSGAVVRRA